MKICPKCREKYPNPDDEFCSNDGARLVLQLDLEADAMVGRSIAGRYDVVGIIGAGGMGTVYRAVQTPIDRVVALKVLKQELTDDRVAVGRFRREAKAASLLSSRHTVTLYEAGEDDDETLFLAMELLEGKSLSGLLFDKTSLPWRDAVEITRQIAVSLSEAHEKGIVHRDLKPENIYLINEKSPGARFCTDDLCVKVLDFGIATLSQPERSVDIGLTRTGVIVGTPGYMSPEQAKGRKADARSDVYALGCLLYEMLTGKPPFESTEAVLLMGQHISAKVPPFETRIPRGEVPEDVEAVVMQMLEKSPEHRIQSARELQSVMASLSDGTYVVPAEVLARQRGEDPPRTRLKMALALGALVTLVAATAVGITLGLSGTTTDDGPSEPTARASLGPAAPDSGGPAKAGDAAPSTVSIHVAVQPPDARILLDGVLVEGNPWTVDRARSDTAHSLVIEADGYARQEHSLRFDSDQRLVLALLRDPEHARSPRPGKARPERPALGSGKQGKRPTSPGADSTVPVKSVPTPPSKTPAKRPGGVNLELDTSFPTGM